MRGPHSVLGDDVRASVVVDIGPDEFIDILMILRRESRLSARTRRKTEGLVMFYFGVLLVPILLVGGALASVYVNFRGQPGALVATGLLVVVLVLLGFVAWAIAMTAREKSEAQERTQASIQLRKGMLRAGFTRGTVQLLPDGVRFSSTSGLGEYPWRRSVNRILSDEAVLVLCNDAGPVVPVPRKSFTHATEAEKFERTARDLLDKAGGPLGAEMVEYLAEHDVVCESCDLPLRGTRSPVCTRCGAEVSASVSRSTERAVA